MLRPYKFDDTCSATPRCKVAFINMVERVVVKRQEYTITLDEGWYSEQDMKDELGWSQSGAYMYGIF